ncbi:hypothetical protein GWI33_004454 [Rhynchophorus ferrugineus]|uniref:Uncharacterized protein n=1 Tax=Rhynchophorus ferrugineus TaxID=354439 RepID=A0A834MKF8_RHYFE|nr:hypothetical protein GWI33_004454 [Rhynchophorus ferrugineus]
MKLSAKLPQTKGDTLKKKSLPQTQKPTTFLTQHLNSSQTFTNSQSSQSSRSSSLDKKDGPLSGNGKPRPDSNGWMSNAEHFSSFSPFFTTQY